MEGLAHGSSATKQDQPTSVENSRGVALSSSLGKAHAKWLRAELTKFFEAGAFESQLGGRPSKSIDMASHIAYLRKEQANIEASASHVCS